LILTLSLTLEIARKLTEPIALNSARAMELPISILLNHHNALNLQNKLFAVILNVD